MTSAINYKNLDLTRQSHLLGLTKTTTKRPTTMKDDEDYEYLEIPDWLFAKQGPYHVGPITWSAEILHSWMLFTFYPIYREKSHWAGELEA